MPLFSEEQRKKYSKHQQEILLIDRITDDVNKVLEEEGATDLYKIKSALFDIVVLTKLLKKIGIELEIEEPIKDIRDSIAHVDERLDLFNFEPTTIRGEGWSRVDNDDGTFKISKTFNFQGAIDSAKLSTDGTVQAQGPYGLIDSNFIWIDRNGSQRSTAIEEIKKSYSNLIRSVTSTI